MWKSFNVLCVLIVFNLNSYSQQIILIEKDSCIHLQELVLPCTIGVNPLIYYKVSTKDDSLVVIGNASNGVYKYVYIYKENKGFVLLRKEKAVYIPPRKWEYIFSDGKLFTSD